MSETPSSSEPVEGTEKSDLAPPSEARKSRPLIMIVAILVVIALISVAAYWLVFMQGEEKAWTVVVDPDSIEMDAGNVRGLTANVMQGTDPADADFVDNCSFMWSVSSTALGSFSYRARQITNFTAALEAGEGTLTCVVTYTDPDTEEEEAKEGSADLTVLPPFLDSISITPSSKRLDPDGGSAVFTATAINSVALPISGIDFTWSISGLSDVTLNATTGDSVTVTAGPTEGFASLNATATYLSVSKTGTANISVAPPPPRTVDFLWYDMFNCSFGDWWERRWVVYGSEQVMSNVYPYYFRWYGSPENTWDYTNMRLAITGRNVSEVNMNEYPEFLPLLSNTERGGTAVLDWYLQYLTHEEMQVYPDATAAWEDGWVVRLSGTATLDKQAAKSVLNLTETGYNSFDSWWSQYKNKVNEEYTLWLIDEASLETPDRHMDIYNAYEYALTLLAFDLDAAKVGDNIVLTYDIVSWGMEVLMTRWMHDSFMETEWYFEDMTFDVTIGPEWADIDVDTIVVYAAYAELGTLNGDLIWGWEPLLQDYVESSPPHPASDYDKYVGKDYLNQAPGSELFGTMMEYDYCPQIWNLTAGETLRLDAPDNAVLFRMHLEPGEAIDYPGHAFINYSEPNVTDMPGTVTADPGGGWIEFTGPVDFWSWMTTQTTHDELKTEWERLDVPPYGIPFIEFEIVEPVVRYVDSFVVTTVSTIPADDLFSVTVTALDQLGTVYKPYDGTIHFSSIAGATLPPDYTFVPGDLGVHTFTDLSLPTAGVQVIRVEDDTNSSTNGTASITVTAKRAADHLEVDLYHMPTVGVPEEVTVTCIDQYGDVFLNYTAVVAFSSNRSATLPPDMWFVAADQGVNSTSPGVTYDSVGWSDLNATDKAVPSVKGSQTDINVTAVPEQIGSFTVSVAPLDLLAGQYPDVTIVAHNQWGGQFLRYVGTVVYSSNASPDVDLPVTNTFVASDGGQKTISGELAYLKSGTFDLVVTDSVIGTATGSQEGIKVELRPQETTFRMYDMMEEPFWPFWDWRYAGYLTDQVLWNEPHKRVLAYSATADGDQIVLQTPYRWSVDALNVSTMDVHDPVFMPTFGPADVPGADARIDIYSQYLYDEWWESYWWPTWHDSIDFVGNNTMYTSQHNDGWLLGTVYNVTMNRQAAEEWMDMPQSADPMTWWTENSEENRWIFYDDWVYWVDNQGDVVYDIYCGYETPYFDQGTMMSLDYDSDTGLVTLSIAHINWGWEVLSARWLYAMGVNHNQLYYDNVTIGLDYGELWSDVHFEGSAQYNMKAVKRYDARWTANTDAAWAWQPYQIDYINSTALHDSKFDPWGEVKYWSNNSGDPRMEQLIRYDSALQWFNLSESQKLIIQLRTDDNVMCFRGEGVGPESWDDLYAGKKTNFTNLMVNGTMSLGYASDPRVTAGYNAATKTITLVGPMDFDGPRWGNDALIEGAPYIEFNVTASGGGTSIPGPIADAGGASSMSMDLVSLMAAAVAALALLGAAVGGARGKR
ncbi:MAG TPA: hypothetical protein VGB78_10075 [Thermoplasmata archaeon]